MPVHFDEPLDAGEQSFSYATWFYTDGNSGDETKSYIWKSRWCWSGYKRNYCFM